MCASPSSKQHTESFDDLNVVRMSPNIRSEDDVEFCIITGTLSEEDVKLPGAVKTLVKDPPTPHGVTLQMPHLSEPRIFTLAPADPPPCETAQLGVTSEALPAVCRTQAKESFARWGIRRRVKRQHQLGGRAVL